MAEISVDNVTKTYGKKKNAFLALSDINVEIPDGVTVAIVGKSGSGKSTLMHAMSGLDRPEKGDVIVDGENILNLKAKQVDIFRSKKMAFVFQSFFVQGNDTCYSNVSLPLEIGRIPMRRRKARIMQALRSVGLEEKAHSKAKNLSGGEKQRLAIARAIVTEPRVLFADEPTGNLDSVTGAKIEKLLFEYARENHATLIVVTHDHDLASRCDMQVYLKDGNVERIEKSDGTRVQPEQPTGAVIKRPLGSPRKVEVQ